ncbi:hypothetical protein PGT21_006244 [Puccinia graminis f. sp. tritici]|uniref:Uncharacterized protein n=1 Tax=Puccinia graminis f. sp. tritici TaxID=56615 RepID=A0A5B0PVD8_PUCGR|nr:hypothetical protein PGT21_006244 [Puccinia graminis f. sp. tritici]KAA1104903.1 hypothetical protein PGTUg99_008754 [Puccinia graminis f. sp. tritici]
MAMINSVCVFVGLLDVSVHPGRSASALDGGSVPDLLKEAGKDTIPYNLCILTFTNSHQFDGLCISRFYLYGSLILLGPPRPAVSLHGRSAP